MGNYLQSNRVGEMGINKTLGQMLIRDDHQKKKEHQL